MGNRAAGEDRVSRIVTKAVLILLVFPVLLLAFSYLVDGPLVLLVRAAGISVETHPAIARVCGAVIVGLVVVATVAVIRQVWPARSDASC